MPSTLSRLLVVLAATSAITWGIAQAQAPTPAPAAPTASPTAVEPQLTVRDIYDRLEAAGYRQILEIEWDDGRYEAKATNAQGERVKLKVNASTGAVERTRTRH